MPLVKSKSKKAFQENVKTELAAGRPLKQSLAIAYATKRDAAKKTGSMKSKTSKSKGKKK